MRHNYWIAAVAALMLSGAASANEKGDDHKSRYEPAKTRQEAIAKAEKRLEALKNKTDEEWAAQNKKYSEKRGEARRNRLKEKNKDDAATPAKPAAPAKKQ
jgi:hypothetical protein